MRRSPYCGGVELRLLSMNELARFATALLLVAKSKSVLEVSRGHSHSVTRTTILRKYKLEALDHLVNTW